MTTRDLYVCAISSDAQTRGDARAQQRTAQLGALESDTGVVEDIATEPGEQRLRLEYRGRYAEKMSAELDELASASAIAEVPYAARNASTPADGYYTLSSSTSGRADPRASEVTTFEGTLAKAGTRASHRRAVTTSPTQVDHPFGNDQTAEIATPATASKVRWFDQETGATAEPSLVATRNAELGDVDVYDAQAAPYSAPTLVYDVDYGDEGAVDVRVWDERGAGAKTDGDGVLQWQKCFVASHEFSGEAILDNGLVRLRFDEAAPSLAVERWDDSGGSWASQSLGTSDWSVWDLDLRSVGMCSVLAKVEFRDTTQSPTAYHSLWCWLNRGWPDPLWGEIDGEGATPTGLEDLLSPAASAQNYDPGASKALVDREGL